MLRLSHKIDSEETERHEADDVDLVKSPKIFIVAIYSTPVGLISMS